MKKTLFIMFLCLSVILCASSCGSEDTVVTADTYTNTEDVPIEPLEEIFKEHRVRFLAVGDNIPHDSVINTARDDAKDGEKYNFSDIYSGISADVKKADIAFINQESPVGGESLGISGYPNFNAPKEMIEELIEVGFDVFNVANNHMLDKGEKGYSNTIEYFNSLPITMIGGYTKSDYDNIRIVDKNGIKVAFLSYTTLVNSGHASDISNSSKYIIPYANTSDMTRQIMLAKEQADAVIVSMHWGTEGKYTIPNSHKSYASLCADLGVDAVIGHHPHVVGDVEWITGDSGNKTLVAYSLGNFCSSQLYSYNMIGEMLKFDIVMDAEGTVKIENVLVDPVVCHYSTDTSRKDNQGLHVRYGVRMYMLRDYTEAMAKVHGAQNWGAFSFNTLKSYITSESYAGVANDFLPDYAK